VIAAGWTTFGPPGPHLVTTGSGPTLATGSGSGSGPTSNLVGRDCAGIITVTAGLLPTSLAVVATLTFGTPFATAPVPLLVASNVLAAALAGVQITATTTGLTITAGTLGLVLGSTYQWTYLVVGV
jgi:hypothetical protein